MPASLIRRIYRGWFRSESFWDTPGMNENLRTIGDHIAIDIQSVGGIRPASGDNEGHTWINTSNGEYSVWSTGPGLESPSWNTYPALRGLIGRAASGVIWGNTGSSWTPLTFGTTAVDVLANDNTTVLFKGIPA
jgi:hypothetical protein